VAEINANCERNGTDFRLLTGTEVDILTDGRLDFPDAVLADLDIVVASIHQGFTGDETAMTRRIIRAAENEFVHCLGHLTGRLLLKRKAYSVNQRKVIDACAACGTWIELNASPQRLDLDWRLWAYARDRGVRCVINCDAHRAEHAAWLRLGAGVARKGGLTRDDVVNTRSLAGLRQLLGAKRARQP
jgi:DNA polymerase (family 10)